MKAKTKLVKKGYKGGYEPYQLQLLTQGTSSSMQQVYEEFQEYQQHLKQETYFVFEQIKATTEFLSSPVTMSFDVFAEEEDRVFGEKLVTKEVNFGDVLKAQLTDIEKNEREFPVIGPVLFGGRFPSSTGNDYANSRDNGYEFNANVDMYQYGGASYAEQVLSQLDQSTINSMDTFDLLEVIEACEQDANAGRIVDERLAGLLVLCIERYQMLTMTGLDKLYLNEVGTSILLTEAFKYVRSTLEKEKVRQTGDSYLEMKQNEYEMKKQWKPTQLPPVKLSPMGPRFGGKRQAMRGGMQMFSVSLPKFLVSTKSVKDTETDEQVKAIEKSQDSVNGLLNTIKRLAVATHNKVKGYSFTDKTKIVQKLFMEIVKWGFKQIVLRLRAPEFDVASIEEPDAFQKELVKFIAKRIEEVKNKAETFMRQRKLLRNAGPHDRKPQEFFRKRFKWIYSILENIEQTLNLLNTLKELAMNPPEDPMSISVSFSFQGVAYDDWVDSVQANLSDLKAMVDEHSENIFNINNYNPGELSNAYNKKRSKQMRLQAANAHLKFIQQTINKNGRNPTLEAEMNKTIATIEDLEKHETTEEEEIEETALQLLVEIQFLVTSMPSHAFVVDISKIGSVRRLAKSVNASAMSVPGLGHIGAAFKTMFGAISGFFSKVPWIQSMWNGIEVGISHLELENILDKMGTIAGAVGDAASSVVTFLPVINAGLLIVHLLICSTLHIRQNGLNIEKKTAAEIRAASSNRMIKQAVAPLKQTNAFPSIRGGKTYKRRVTCGGVRERFSRIGTSPMASRGQLAHGSTVIKTTFEPAKDLSVVGKGINLLPRAGHHVCKLLDAGIEEQLKTSFIYQFEQMYKTLYDHESERLSRQSNVAYGQRANLDELHGRQVALNGTLQAYNEANAQITGADSRTRAVDVVKRSFPEFGLMKSPDQYKGRECKPVPKDVEPPYIISTFVTTQLKSLRHKIPEVQKHRLDCSELLHRVGLDDDSANEDKQIVEDVLSAYNDVMSPPASRYGGGKKPRLTGQQVEEIKKYLGGKSSRDLVQYARSKGIKIVAGMKKSDVVDSIVSMKKQQR